MSVPRANKGRRATGFAAATVIILSAIAIGSVWLWTSSDSNAGDSSVQVEAAQWYRVEPTDFDITIVVTGELQAAEQTEIKSQVDGRVAIVEIVEEGTFVEEGDLLVRLDSSNIAEKIDREQLNVETAQSEMVSAQQELELQRSKSATDVRDAQVKLELAELDLAKWKEGEVKQRRRDLKLALEKAQRRIERAKEDLINSKSFMSNVSSATPSWMKT